jgi:hypothetical protein
MAGPYAFFSVGSGSGGIVAWDTASDTQAAILLSAGTNIHRDHSTAISADGKTLYARGAVGVGKIDTQTLAASMVPNTSAYSTAQPVNSPYVSIAGSPDGSEFYVAYPPGGPASGPVSLAAVNGTTGTIRASVSIGTIPTGASRVGMAISPDGSLIFVGQPITAYRSSDLSVAYVAGAGVAGHYGSVMGFSPNGQIAYYYDQSASLIGAFNTTNGASISTLIVASVDDLVIDSTGNTGYFSSFGNTTVTKFTTSPLAVVGTVNVGTPWNIASAGILPDNSAFYACNLLTSAANQIVKIALPAFATATKFAFTGSAAGASINWVVARSFTGPPPANPPSTPVGLAWNTPLKPDGAPYCQGNKLSVSWLPVVGASAYRLRRGGVIVYDGPLAVFDDYGVTAGLIYSYTVSAYNGQGESAQSAAVLMAPCPLQAFGQRCLSRVGSWGERCITRSQ